MTPDVRSSLTLGNIDPSSAFTLWDATERICEQLLEISERWLLIFSRHRLYYTEPDRNESSEIFSDGRLQGWEHPLWSTESFLTSSQLLPAPGLPLHSVIGLTYRPHSIDAHTHNWMNGYGATSTKISKRGKTP